MTDTLGGASKPIEAPKPQDTDRVPLDFRRPDHLENETWDAIQVHVRRLEGAQNASDAGWVIGCAKDLIECVARVVLDAKGVSLSGVADSDETLNAAHQALQRQPGQDVSMSPDIRAIASSAKKMVLTIRSVRNNDGAGHGRARVRAIDEETVTVVFDATVLWVRWALRRLEHILIGEADRLIAELRDAIVYQRSLKEHLDAVMLPDQPPETQRAIGFAQRTMEDSDHRTLPTGSVQHEVVAPAQIPFVTARTAFLDCCESCCRPGASRRYGTLTRERVTVHSVLA